MSSCCSYLSQQHHFSLTQYDVNTKYVSSVLCIVLVYDFEDCCIYVA